MPADKKNKLWGAADASYASDVITRRSHGGYMLFLNGGCVSWKSDLQKMVTLSSCESEFVALCSAILEVRSKHSRGSSASQIRVNKMELR